MARFEFGGVMAAWVVSSTQVANAASAQVRAVTLLADAMPLSLYDAPGGTEVTDFLDETGQSVTQITVLPSDPYIPRFSGPDGVTSLWVQADGGRWLPVPRWGDGSGVYVTEEDVQTLGDARYVQSTQFNDFGDARYALVAQLQASNDTDDTATINSILAASVGKRVRGLPGETYLISAPLVLRSATELDMTGCTITLKASANCNMLSNAAVAPQRTITGVSITGTAITSAVANFTSADIGRSVVASAAGPAGTTWTSVIASVTDSSNAVLATAAITNVAAASVTVHNRDRNITIVGGTWARGSNAGVGNALHSMLFRRVDGLTVRGVSATSSAGKYAINIADVTHLIAKDLTFDTSSDGIHITGPASAVTVQTIRGRTLDNTVAFGTGDYVAYQDVSGPIDQVFIGDVRVDSGCNEPIRIFNVTGGPPISNILIDGVSGTSTSHGMTIGTADTGPLANVAGVMVRNVTITPADSYAQVYINGTSFGDIQVTGLSLQTATNTKTGVLTGPNLSADSVTISNVSHPGAGAYRAINHHATAYIRSLELHNIQINGRAARTDGRVANLSGQVDRCLISNAQIRNGATLVFNNSSSPCYFLLENCDLDQPAEGVNLAGSAAHIVQASNIRCWTSNGAFRFTGTGTGHRVRFSNVALAGGGGALIARSATQTLRANGLDCQVDLSWVSGAVNGDVAYNTNGALSCGVGPAVYNGTSWKNLHTGATYAPA